MKSKGQIIALIVLLSIVALLLISFLVFSLTNNFNFIKNITLFSFKSSNVIFDQRYETEDINFLDIIQDAGDIVIKKAESDYFQVILYGDDESGLSVETIGGTLKINNTRRRKFTLFNFGNVKNDIIVYIPSNYAGNINIKSDYGNIEVLDLENASLNIDSDAGDINLGKINNIDIKCDYGNIEIKEVLNRCNIKADCGNVKIEKAIIYEDSSINVDLGNVDISEINDIYIDANVDLGKTNLSSNNRSSNISLKINCDLRKYNYRRITNEKRVLILALFIYIC